MMLPAIKIYYPARLSLLVLGAMLSACDLSIAQRQDQEVGVALPGRDHLKHALHAAHASPKGGAQECLGRVMWDTAWVMEWGVKAPDLNGDDRFRFTQVMHGGQDNVGFGNISAVVLAPASWKQVEDMHESVAIEKRLAIREYRQRIRVAKRIIDSLEDVLQDPSKNINGDDLTKYPQSIANFRSELSSDEASIANIEKDWHPLDVGLPDALGYAAGPTLYAFLLRDGRAYRFMSTGGEHEAPFEERMRAFLDMLKRFKVRQLHEIPTEPGLCIPYGFIPDDGRGHFRMEVSMRYKDRPGVIYTIGTAVVGERGIEAPDSVMLQATARAAAGSLTGALTAGRDVKTIGPRPAHIGALPAYQGGISMNVAEPGKPAVYSYSVYTGHAGWMHSRVLPAITVNMRSFTPEQEPSLKQNPPPLDESMKRLEALLKSMRLRPTTPVMPELANLNGK